MAVAVLGILGAFTLPMVASAASSVKLKDNADTISNTVGLAKMRATAKFARARVYANTSAGTFKIQLYNTTTAAWVDDGGTTTLPSGVRFGFGSITTPPADTQNALGQSEKCKSNAGDDITGTACIIFNSRGIPINSTGAPIGGNAFYLTDGTGVRGVTVTATPLVKNWWSSADHAGWVRQ